MCFCSLWTYPAVVCVHKNSQQSIFHTSYCILLDQEHVAFLIYTCEKSSRSHVTQLPVWWSTNSSRGSLVFQKLKLSDSRICTCNFQGSNTLNYPLGHDDNGVAVMKFIAHLQTRNLKFIKSWENSKSIFHHIIHRITDMSEDSTRQRVAGSEHYVAEHQTHWDQHAQLIEYAYNEEVNGLTAST